MNFSDFKLGHRIAFAVGLQLILPLAVATTAALQLKSLYVDTSQVANDRVPKLEHAAD